MRKHRSSLFVIAGLGVVGLVALHQPSGPSADATGRTAALVSAHLATDSLSPVPTTEVTSTTASTASSTTGDAAHGVALTSLNVPTSSTGPAVVDIPATNPSTTTTGTTTPPTTTTTSTSTTTTTTLPATIVAAGTTPAGGVWAELRQCESDDNYGDDTGNGYYGAYQFSEETWLGIGESGLPSDAPPAVQDAAAKALQARSGWGQWPACAAKLGLL